MTTPARPRIVLRVTAGRRGFLKFTPPERSGLHPFQVDKTALEESSNNVRTAIEELCDLHLKAPLGGPAKHETETAVRRIARQGHLLSKRIFQMEQNAGTIVADWIAAESPYITFFVDRSVDVHAPYGLLFYPPNRLDLDPDKLDEQALRQHFWQSEYGVTVAFALEDQRGDDWLGNSVILDGTQTKLFGIFNREVIIFANGEDPKWKRQAFSVPEFTGLWSREACPHNILYFFCHADEGRLKLGQGISQLDYVLSANEFEETILVGKRPLNGLILLNGCRTAVFSGKGTWLKATRASGFSGFIGTEATVPTVFAWRFGNDLLHLILREGLRPLEALRKLWDTHWPLGMLYGLYCVPDILVDPVCTTSDIRPPQGTNYSMLPLFASHEHSTML